MIIRLKAAEMSLPDYAVHGSSVDEILKCDHSNVFFSVLESGPSLGMKS